MRKKYLISLTTLFIIIISIVACGNKNKAKTETIYNVRVVHPQDNNSLNTKDYIGIIQGDKNSKLSFQVPGQLKSINVVEGQYVSKGALLATLDATNLKNQVNAAKATLDQALDAFNRLKILYDNGSLPEIKYVEVKTKLSQAQSAYGIAKRNLNNSSLYAPFSGIIGHKAVQVGENVIPSQEVFTLIDVSKLKVEFEVPEQEINKLQLGDKAIVVVGVIPDKKFNARVISKRLDASDITHSYSVAIALDDASAEISPGMACDIKLICSPELSEGSMIVPISSVQVEFNGDNYVWLAKDGKAVKRKVEIGDFVSGGLIIKKGLSLSDLVITKGYHKLSNGSKIKTNE